MTTRMRVKTREYDMESAIANTPLNILHYMVKRVGVTMESIVVGLQSMNTTIESAKTARKEGDATAAPTDTAAIMNFLSTEDGIDAFRGLLWLLRTTAGERAEGKTSTEPGARFLTLEEAAEGIGLLDFEFLNEPDPTQLGASPEDSPSSSPTSSETSPITS